MLVVLLVFVLGGISANAQSKWVKTDLADVTSTDQIVIVDLNSKMAMSNNNGTKAPVATAVKLSSDNSELTGTIDDKLIWNVTSTTSSGTTSYTFIKKSTTDHLYCISNNNGVRVGTGSASTFTVYSSGKYVGLYNVVQKRYIGVYTKKEWRCYQTVNANIQSTSMAYYKLTSSESSKTTTSLAFATGNKLFQQGQTTGLDFTNAATLTPSVEGATITYASDNENIAVVDENTGEVTVDTKNAGTATITASYAGNDTYSASSAKYTITVEPVYQTIAELKAAYSSSTVTGLLRLTDAQVTYVNGNSHYLQDASGAVNVYNSSFDYKAGDKLNGIANVTYTLYKGLPEITDFTAYREITATSGDAPAPTEMTVKEAQEDANLCKYIIVKNVTVTPGKSGNATATDKDGNSITVFKTDQDYTTGQYDITGIASIYVGNKETTREILFISYAPDFEIDEDADENAITAGENATVTFSRTFNKNAWNSLVLPFAMTAEQLTSAFGSNAKFAKYTGTTQQTDGTYTLNFETVTATEANVPVFVWGANDAVETVTGVIVVSGDATSTPTDAAFSFTGSYSKATTKAGDWFISSDNNFYKAVGTESIKATRAVFRPVTAESAAKALSFSIDGTTTSIKSINADSIVLDSNAPMYNLAGQRVDSSFKGVVIQNGKKFIK